MFTQRHTKHLSAVFAMHAVQTGFQQNLEANDCSDSVTVKRRKNCCRYDGEKPTMDRC